MRRLMRPLVVLLAVSGLAVVGCAPPDVAGNYDVNLLNIEETCPDVDEGDELNDVALDVTQADNIVQASATFFWLIFPLTYDFLGETHRRGFVVDSTDAAVVDVDGPGGNCTMSYSFTIDAVVDGDVISGEVLQSGESNGDPDCMVDSCTATWDLLGVRLP